MPSSVRARFEFKIEDSWVGVFWKRTTEEHVEADESGRSCVLARTPRLDVWICFVPWFPLHVVVMGQPERWDAMQYIGDKMIREVADDRGWSVDVVSDVTP